MYPSSAALLGQKGKKVVFGDDDTPTPLESAAPESARMSIHPSRLAAHQASSTDPSAGFLASSSSATRAQSVVKTPRPVKVSSGLSEEERGTKEPERKAWCLQSLESPSDSLSRAFSG